MPVTIKAVVFDVGAVLIDWDPRHLYRKLFDREDDMTAFLNDVCTFEWNVAQDNGRTWAEAIDERVALFPDHEPLIRAYSDRWPEMVSGPIHGTVAIKSALQEAGIPCYAITNFSSEKWQLAQTLYPFLADFDGVIVSGDEKVMKPHPSIYEALYKRYNLKPEECLFIDDRLENIEGARATGMDGVVFTNPDDLAQTLEQHFNLKLAA